MNQQDGSGAMPREIKQSRSMRQLTAVAFNAMCTVVLAYSLITLGGRVGFSIQYLAESLKRHAGEADSLPQSVVAAQGLAEKVGMSPVRLARHFTDDSLLSQRATEFLYPIRIDERSLIIIAPAAEHTYPACRILDAENSVAIHDCSENR